MLPANFFKDEDSKKEFIAQQNKLIDLTRQLNVQRQTLQYKSQAKRRNEAYRKELEKVGADTGAFKAVGRMFIRTTIPEAQSELDERVRVATQDIATAQKNIEYLEKSVDNDEKALKEILEKQMPPKA